MKPGILVRIAAGACLAASVQAAYAADISNVEASAATVTLSGGRAAVRFNVSGTASGNDNCGYYVDYGDGKAGDSRAVERENGRFSRSHERTFTAPGTYTVKASGRNRKTTQACNGSASTVVTVVAAAAAPVAARPACPEGWALNERSFNPRTGAFSCTAKPAQQLVCGDRLRYYERDGIIGCRANRRRDG